MDMGWVATIIGSLVTVIISLFGASFWGMLRLLVNRQQYHVDQKQIRIEQQELQIQELRDKLEDWERAYHTALSEVQVRDNMIDNYRHRIEILEKEIRNLQK